MTNPEVKQNQPKLDENLMAIEQNPQLEKQIAFDKTLDKKEFDPTKNRLAREHQTLFPKKVEDLINPIEQKHPEHEKIASELTKANEVQTKKLGDLDADTTKTKEQLIVLFPAIAPTVDTVKAENKEPTKPEESFKTAFLDKEKVSDSIEDPSQYAA